MVYYITQQSEQNCILMSLGYIYLCLKYTLFCLGAYVCPFFFFFFFFFFFLYKCAGDDCEVPWQCLTTFHGGIFVERIIRDDSRKK